MASIHYPGFLLSDFSFPDRYCDVALTYNCSSTLPLARVAVSFDPMQLIARGRCVCAVLLASLRPCYLRSAGKCQSAHAGETDAKLHGTWMKLAIGREHKTRLATWMPGTSCISTMEQCLHGCGRSCSSRGS